ncbi:MAG: hypothetical protein DRI95_02545 [Bacteroidetes bacterium]|nr:MAG: hypothetical protein DRI89_00020 [Bacteroidota bacterium]RLD68589.1 MAG: hypothetical protein DRI95_02545 [Bacteroidota bacterium]
MKVSNLNNPLIDWVTKYESKLVDIFFWLFIASFLIDRIINYFIHFPFFVGSALLMFPFLFFITQHKNPDRKRLMIAVFSFVLITIINSIVYLFGVKNISDLLFIILFITIYFYYRKNINNLKTANTYLFFALSLFLFSFTFFNIDSNSIHKHSYTSTLRWITSYDEEPEKLKKIRLKNEKLELAEKGMAKKRLEESGEITWKSNELDILEILRIYHNGLFRIPHIASYFFGFLFLFFAHQYRIKKKILFVVLMVISIGLCIYSGSRAILLAFVLSTIIFLFNRKYILYLAMIFVAILILIFSKEYFLQISKDTFFFQYFTLIETTLENFSRLSRYRLWYSWWTEVSEFGFWEFVIGNSFMSAMYANAVNLNFKEWFHNDFLSIFYTFGIWCTLLYIWFFIKIYRDYKMYIKQNIFIFIFYASMIITAFVNGFYYYFPVFLLYLFLLMIKNEKQLAQ